MAVTLGNISSSSGNTTTLSWDHTTAAGADKEIRVCISLPINESVSSVTWDAATENISGVLIRAEQNAGAARAEIWEINDPSGGVTRQIDVTCASKARILVGAVDFSGAAADTGVDDAGSSADSATSVSNSPSNVVSDDFVVDALAMSANQGATTGASQTDIYNAGLHPTIGGAASHQDGANGAAMSWTFTSANMAHAACRVPSAAPGDQDLDLDDNNAGIASGVAFGQHQFTVYLIHEAGIASGVAFGSHAIVETLYLDATGIASVAAFGSHTIAEHAYLVPEGIASTAVFGDHGIETEIPTQFLDLDGAGIPGQNNIPFGIGTAEIEENFVVGPQVGGFGEHVISETAYLVPEGIASGVAFGNHSLREHATLDLGGAAIPSGALFGEHGIATDIATQFLDLDGAGIPSGVGGALPSILDAAQTDTSAQGVSSHSYSITVSSGTNTMLVVALAWEDDGVPQTSSTIAFNTSESLTKISNASHEVVEGSNSLVQEFWYLLAPTATTANLVVTMTGAIPATAQLTVSAVVVQDAKQSEPSPVDKTGDTGSPTSISTTLNTVTANSLLLDSVTLNTDSNPTVQDGEQTETYDISVATGTAMRHAGSEEDFVAGGTEDMGWTFAAQGRVGHAIIALPPVVGAGFGNHVISEHAYLDLDGQGIASGVVFGEHSLREWATLDLTGAGIASGVAFGEHTIFEPVAGSAQFLDLDGQGIASAAVFGLHSISETAYLVTTGIASGVAFGSHSIREHAFLVVEGIASGVAFGSHSVREHATLDLTGAGIASTEAFGQQQLTLYLIHEAGIPSGEAFGADYTIWEHAYLVPTGIASSVAFGVHTISGGVPFVPPVFGAASVNYGESVSTQHSINSSQQQGVGSATVRGKELRRA